MSKVIVFESPPNKELFIIIPIHMMNRELIPGKKIRRCPLSTVTVADALISSVKVSAALT